MAKILWITENFYPRKGGMAASCDRIVHELRNNGNNITVVHLLAHGNYYQETTPQGHNLHFPLSDMPDGTVDEAHTLNLLWLKIKSLTPQIVVAFGGTVCMTAAEVFAAWWAVPLVVLLRGNDFDTGVFSPKKREILDRCLSRAQAVCCVSSEKVAKVQAMYPSTKAFFTPNGIGTDLWRILPSDTQKAQQWRQATVTPHKRVVGIFGELKAKKGIIVWLEALQNTGFHIDTHLLIVGSMSMELQAYWAGVHTHWEFTLLPFLERYALLPYYLACDVVAIPSFYDGMPNVLLEVAALGIPLLTSDAGGMPDVLPQHYPLIFRAGEQQSCEQTIQTYFKSPISTWQQWGQTLQQIVKENFTVGDEAARYQDIFTRLLEL